MRLPRLSLSSSVKDSRVLVVGANGESHVTLSDNKGAVSKTTWIDPAHILFGVAIDAGAIVQLAVDFDWVWALDGVLNTKAGALFRVNQRLDPGLGASYDLPNTKALGAELIATRVTYIGGTLGGTFRTLFRVENSKRRDGLILTTTLAVRYAAGFGQSSQIEVNDSGTRLSSANIVVHDIMPYTGSSISF